MTNKFARWRTCGDLRDDVYRFQDSSMQTVLLSDRRGRPVHQLSRAVNEFNSCNTSGLHLARFQEANTQRERHFYEAWGNMPFTSNIFGDAYVRNKMAEQSVVLWKTLAQWLGSPDGWDLVGRVITRAEQFPQGANKIVPGRGCRKFLDTSQKWETGIGDAQGNDTRISPVGTWGYGYRRKNTDNWMNLSNYPSDLRPTEGGAAGSAAWCWMEDNVIVRDMQFNSAPALIPLMSDRGLPSKADQVDAANFFLGVFGCSGRRYWKAVSLAVAGDASMSSQLRDHTVGKIGKLLELADKR